MRLEGELKFFFDFIKIGIVIVIVLSMMSLSLKCIWIDVSVITTATVYSRLVIEFIDLALAFFNESQLFK